MKILHILSQMPDFTGSGKTVQAVIRQARAKGHENFLVAGVQDGFKPDSSLISRERTCFLEFNGRDLDFPLPGMSDVMPYPSTVFSVMTPEQLAAYEAGFETLLIRARAQFKPDIIHSHHLWIVSKIARRVFERIPMVTSCHGTCLRQFSLCPGFGQAVQAAISGIDAVLCLSEHQKEEVRSIHKVDLEKLHVVGGGFDRDLFFPAPKPDKGPIQMVYAGKLSRAKGVPWLLRSLKQVQQPDFRLHLAGSGSGEEFHESLALAAQLGKKVKVHGPLSHRDLADLMRKSHFFVLPSFFEGLPLVLMEALSSGCRLLTTDLPGACEILGDHLSDMVDLVRLPPLETVDTPFDRDWPALERDLAQALDRAIRKAAACRQPDLAQADNISQAYTWEKVFSRMESVYEQVVQQTS